ncbi:MAG: asparagine synthase (glutamine-hydrolyzing) [Chromatiales bacterium]|nr:asparagine synthase (glutamine-hydrolyzing) [Chromatiales bacterium]
MCGFLGVLAPDRLESGSAWQAGQLRYFDGLRDRMRSRGPDGSGTWSAPGVILGHRRLAILDLTDSGAQPMVSAAGTVLVFNGEIYNYLELRSELEADGARFTSSGDTVVLLEALDRWGLERTLGRIRGMYAFAAWRPRDRQLWLARDPVGKKPVFIGRAPGSIVFGSALEPVLAWMAGSGYRPILDPVAINHVLATGWVPAPRTGLKGIEKLESGTYRVIGPGGAERISVHWRVPFPTQRSRLDAPTEENLATLFDQAIERRLRSDVPIATFLSGGLDSSLVTAAASRKYPKIVAFTARTNNDNDDEFALARRIASHLGVEHRIVEIEADLMGSVDAVMARYGEAYCDSSALPTFAISREVGRSHRVVLTGDGGDEVQGGYATATMAALRAMLRMGDPLVARHGGWLESLAERLDAPELRAAERMPGWRFRLLRLLAPPLEALTLRHDGLDRSDSLLADEARSELGTDEWRQWLRSRLVNLGAPSGLDAQLGFDFSVYLADDLNVKVDVAGMAHSLEARCPLLDLDFVEACWGVRTLDRVRPWERKRVIQRLARRYLPRGLLMRRKQGFSVPVYRWLQSSGVRDDLVSALRGRRTGLEGILNIPALLAAFDARHQPGELTWRIFALSRWKKWVDGVASNAAGDTPLP